MALEPEDQFDGGVPDSADIDAEGTDAAQWNRWGNLWQVPTIAVCLVLTMVALYVTTVRAPENDFDGAMGQVERLISQGSLDLARMQLQEVIEPHLEEATDLEQGRYEACMGDYIYAAHVKRAVWTPQFDQMALERYEEAVKLGYLLDAPRLERWAEALINMGEIEAARRRLAELEALAIHNEEDPSIRQRRNRVLRRLVEASLRAPELQYGPLVEVLDEYRSDGLLTLADELWAVARQADLRLEAGEYQDALDHLLVEARRIEHRARAEGSDLSFGEIYFQMGRAYYHLGRPGDAEFHLRRAREELSPHDALAADATVLLGRLALGSDDLEQALLDFDLVVREHPGVRAFVPALLGRAEVYGITGRHELSAADYHEVQRQLAEGRPRRDVMPMRVSDSLMDRHDASMAQGDFERALAYIDIAVTLFEAGEVPPPVLFRVATTNRQIADSILGRQTDPLGEVFPRVVETDPALRNRANAHYRRAGDYAAMHARALAGLGGDDDRWAQSLWLAADSYDLGGETEQAITHFIEYLEGKPQDDPTRPRALFRLGQAHHAQLEYDKAIEQYELLVQNHPRTIHASRTYVPLARAYQEQDRNTEAIELLRDVVGGNRLLEPDAPEFRDALVELGRMHHERNEYVEAIERLEEASNRFPRDDDHVEIRYRLADSHRSLALELADRIDGPNRLGPSQQRRLDEQRMEHLRTAMGLFKEVTDKLQRVIPDQLDRLDQDILRYSYLHNADCAYYLGDYPAAIELYEQMVRRYPDHHSSMNALAQIVNCHTKLGNLDRVQEAHRRALFRLKQLPDIAFAAPDAFMDRNAWEQWLRNVPLSLGTASAN